MMRTVSLLSKRPGSLLFTVILLQGLFGRIAHSEAPACQTALDNTVPIAVHQGARGRSSLIKVYSLPGIDVLADQSTVNLTLRPTAGHRIDGNLYFSFNADAARNQFPRSPIGKQVSSTALPTTLFNRFDLAKYLVVAVEFAVADPPTVEITRSQLLGPLACLNLSVPTEWPLRFSGTEIFSGPDLTQHSGNPTVVAELLPQKIVDSQGESRPLAALVIDVLHSMIEHAATPGFVGRPIPKPLSAAARRVAALGDPLAGLDLLAPVDEVSYLGRSQAMVDGHPLLINGCMVLNPALVFAPGIPRKDVPQLGWNGTVDIALVVDETGSPRDEKVTRTFDPAANALALANVSGWRFKPAVACGKPVLMSAHVQVIFGF